MYELCILIYSWHLIIILHCLSEVEWSEKRIREECIFSILIISAIRPDRWLPLNYVITYHGYYLGSKLVCSASPGVVINAINCYSFILSFELKKSFACFKFHIKHIDSDSKRKLKFSANKIFFLMSGK